MRENRYVCRFQGLAPAKDGKRNTGRAGSRAWLAWAGVVSVTSRTTPGDDVAQRGLVAHARTLGLHRYSWQKYKDYEKCTANIF